MASRTCVSAKVLVIGHRRVGKTTMIKQLRTIASMHFGDRHTSNGKQGGVSLTKDSLKFIEATLFDMPNFRRFTIEAADAFILVYAADDDDSYKYVTSLIKEVRECKGENVPLIVVSNKSDIEVPIERRIMAYCVLATDYRCDHIEASAINGNNLQNVFAVFPQKCDQYIVFRGNKENKNNNKNDTKKDKVLKKRLPNMFRRLFCITQRH